MARKYDLISELYNRTCKTVVSNPQNWQAFLASACRNYKLRYDEQLLVYAQRPDATAVLEIEQWNKIFGRWVNRGARGIAVFADENRSRQRLTHYFDISDTHESRYSRTVPIWDMRQEYEADVIETLESTFGEIENKSSLAEAIMGAARNAAEDNIPDYLQDLYYATEGSSFEEVEEDIVAFIYKNVVTNSVAYMMMSRLAEYLELYRQNEDMVGWIKVEDTNINYPVVQSVNEPNFYLKHKFDKTYSAYGCPYVQENCDVQKPSDNIIIYGHHMNDGSMFMGLMKYRNKSFWEGHKMITFDTLTDRHQYEVIAVFKTVVYTNSSDSFKYYEFTYAEKST